MKKSQKSDKSVEAKSWKARLRMAVASFALAGVLAGGAAIVANDAPVQNEDDTTEVAWESSKLVRVPPSYTMYARSSWH